MLVDVKMRVLCHPVPRGWSDSHPRKNPSTQLMLHFENAEHGQAAANAEHPFVLEIQTTLQFSMNGRKEGISVVVNAP